LAQAIGCVGWQKIVKSFFFFIKAAVSKIRGGSGDPDSRGHDFGMIVAISACSRGSHGDVAKLLEDEEGA